MGTNMDDPRACPVDREELVALASGDLEPERQVAVSRHVAECTPCRREAVRSRAAGRSVAGITGVVRWHRFESRFGDTWLAATSEGLARVSWQHEDADAFVSELERLFPDVPVVPDPGQLAEAERQLSEYFRGDRRAFDLPVDLEGVSEFDRRVLEAAEHLEFGEVVPYGELARRIGRPKAARAVGGALGRNPVAIVVPCHRVVRSDGSLGGYGSGVEYKERLLRIEGREDLLRAS